MCANTRSAPIYALPWTIQPQDGTPETAELVHPGIGNGYTIRLHVWMEQEVVGSFGARTALLIVVFPCSSHSFGLIFRLKSLKHGPITAQRNRKVMSIHQHITTARLSPHATDCCSDSSIAPEPFLP
jgi:hypothetical protein